MSTSTREVGDAALAQTPSAETTPRCAGPLRLVGSMMAANDPSRSLAAIRMNGGTRLTQLDEKIGELTLVAIHPANAYFRRDDGSACRLPVFLPRAERTPPPPAPSPRASAPAIRPTGAELAELNAGIRKTGPNSYALTREVVGKALGSVTALWRSGRFQVKQESGRVVGMQLVRMRKDSPLARLGLQPGDIVRSLNGHDLTSPTGALGALQTARSQSAFSLALIRGGAPQSLRYEVQ